MLQTKNPDGTSGVGEGSILMSLLTSLSRIFRVEWFDWRRPATRDSIVLFAAIVLASVLAHVYELGPHLFQIGMDYAEWEFDDIIFVAFVLSIALTIYSVRRYRDLADEIRARAIAEREIRNLARHDPLTGLPNRRLFDEKLDACLGGASATHQVAVLLLGLDGFKRRTHMALRRETRRCANLPVGSPTSCAEITSWHELEGTNSGLS
jgi:Diguanylate cyclase, GGDEF domain